METTPSMLVTCHIKIEVKFRTALSHSYYYVLKALLAHGGPSHRTHRTLA
jgi:hypothetical protein